MERLIFGDKGVGVGEGKGRVVLGARVDSGEEIRADITILAAGAWSAALMPRELASRLRAKGQIVAYVGLDEEEARMLRGKPVFHDMTKSMFVMPPPPAGDEGEHEGILKVARHGHGYEHRVDVKDVVDDQEYEAYVPPPDFQTLPKEGDVALRSFLKAVVPSLGDKPWCQTRICVYTDTPSGDFLIDWIPGYGKSILVASGGSGHGYKFTPLVGEQIVSKLEGRLGTHPGSLGARLDELWRWRSDDDVKKLWEGDGDGSRGGPKGMIWEEEMMKT